MAYEGFANGQALLKSTKQLLYQIYGEAREGSAISMKGTGSS